MIIKMKLKNEQKINAGNKDELQSAQEKIVLENWGTKNFLPFSSANGSGNSSAAVFEEKQINRPDRGEFGMKNRVMKGNRRILRLYREYIFC